MRAVVVAVVLPLSSLLVEQAEVVGNAVLVKRLIELLAESKGFGLARDARKCVAA